MKYNKLRRTDSVCNICQEIKPLSWDHIPPKGGIDLSDMWVQTLTNSMVKEDRLRPSVSQNGLKYRTICQDCNSLLGKYDRSYKELLLDIKTIMTSSLIIPDPITLQIYPLSIAKSLLGHCLTAKTGNCESSIDDEIRVFATNDRAHLPKNMRIFFWYYPYNCTIIKTDFLEYDIDVSITKHYAVIKSFPVAFTVTFDGSIIENANELIVLSSDTFRTKRAIHFSPSKINKWNYPEELGDGKIHLVTQDRTSIIATPKSKLLKQNKK